MLIYLIFLLLPLVVIDTTLCTKEEVEALNSLQNQLKARERARQAQLAAQANSPQSSTEMVCKEI